MLSVDFAELSDRGLSRENNEDFLGHVAAATPAQAESHGWLFALADGVGGQDRGEVASRVAIETLLAGFKKIPKGVMHVSLLPRLMQDANAAVFQGGHEGAGRGRQMATTLVACALRFDSAVISHVGDSRCYLFRDGKGAQLTRDHTMVAEQMRMGILSAEEAAVHENRHILTRSLGNEMFVAADTITVNIIPGDTLLLCSDGLHGYVPDKKIERIVSTSFDVKETAEELVAEANRVGGHDNVTVQVIRIRTVERMGLYRGRPYRL